MLARVIQRCSKSWTPMTQTFKKCFTAIGTPSPQLLWPLICCPLSFEFPVLKKLGSNQGYALAISQRFFSNESFVKEEMSCGASVGEEKSDTWEEEEMSSDSAVEKERAMNIELQKEHMKTLRIDGLVQSNHDPESAKEEVLKLCRAIGVPQGLVVIKNIWILPLGRILCQLSDPGSVNMVLSRRWNLDKVRSKYPHVFVGPSLCKAYMAIRYHVRTLKKEGKIDHCGIFDGTNEIRLLGSDELLEITHIQDLVELGLL